MKNLLSCVSAIALCCFVFFDGNAQEQKWTASVHVGLANSEVDYESSKSNTYRVYGKLPYDLIGYDPSLTNVDPSATGPASGGANLYSVRLNYQLSEYFNIGITGFVLPQTAGWNIQGGASIGGQSSEFGTDNSFAMRNISASLGFKFLHIRKGYFEANVNIGSTFIRLTEMFFVESRITDPPGVFKGLAEDFIERKDWAFTWGLGIAYHYQLGKHWGLVAGFDFNTLNFQPDFGYRYSYKINGEEMVNSLSLRERQFIFSDELTDRPNEPNAGRVLPRESIRYVIPQISLGVTFGFL